MVTNRAEYQRQRRARMRAERQPYTCAQCGTPFDPEMSNARFCSDACRAAAWREITHRASRRAETGWQYDVNESGYPGVHRCIHYDGVTSCGQPATWLTLSVRNEQRHLAGASWWCDDHVPADRLEPCDKDASCHGGAECPVIVAVEQLIPR